MMYACELPGRELLKGFREIASEHCISTQGNRSPRSRALARIPSQSRRE
jgi:hypothetical protein